MASTINEIQDEIIDEFGGFDDWMDKYQLLIDLGNEQEPLDEKYKTESNLIDGCQSRVWLQADYADGLIHFSAESDALIVKGIVALLIRVLSGHTPQEILDADLYFIDEIGLRIERVINARRILCISIVRLDICFVFAGRHLYPACSRIFTHQVQAAERRREQRHHGRIL